MGMLTLPKIGNDETFVNTDYITGTQLYTGRVPERLLIYVVGMPEHVTITASDTITTEQLREINDQIRRMVNTPKAHRTA